MVRTLMLLLFMRFAFLLSLRHRLRMRRSFIVKDPDVDVKRREA